MLSCLTTPDRVAGYGQWSAFRTPLVVGFWVMVFIITEGDLSPQLQVMVGDFAAWWPGSQAGALCPSVGYGRRGLQLPRVETLLTRHPWVGYPWGSGVMGKHAKHWITISP